MPVTVNEALDGHAAPDLECLDRDMTRKCPCLRLAGAMRGRPVVSSGSRPARIQVFRWPPGSSAVGLGFRHRADGPCIFGSVFRPSLWNMRSPVSQLNHDCR